MRNLVLAAVAAAAAALPAQASIVVTYEAAGAVNTTARFSAVGVERFANAALDGTGGYTTTFGGSGFTGVYRANPGGDLRIIPADTYGGDAAPGDRYPVAFTSAGYSLTLAFNGGAPVTYFGYWLSALDRGNLLDLYRGNQRLLTFDPATVLAAVGGCDASNPYCGKPVGPSEGQNPAEPYVFVNFFDRSGRGFDRLVFREDSAGGGGYESDNHTVGRFDTVSGTAVAAPGAAAVFGAGLFGLGLAGRRRRRPAA